MATVTWETAKELYCDRVKQRVALVEQRVYPADFMPYPGGLTYQVRSRRCSSGIECNVAGRQCRWSGLNPNYDPFAEQ
jgi:hypothetical protein